MTKREVVELPQALVSKIQETISNYAIGFVGVRDPGTGQNPGKDQDGYVAGSGTLVSFGKSRGILTAAHVLKNLGRPQEYEFVLPFPRAKRHRLSVPAQHCETVLIGPSQNEADGPDIACLVLSDADARRIEPYKSFYDLEALKREVLYNPADLTIGVWQLVGMIEEMTKDADVQPRQERVKEFWCLMGEVGFPVETARDGYDFLDSEIKPPAGEVAPDSFGGTSGGALWHILLGRKDDVVDATKFVLSGVAYFESRQPNRRSIISNGRRTIYDKMLGALPAGKKDS
nr:hypothetical protein [Nitrosomonas nitrosa]